MVGVRDAAVGEAHEGRAGLLRLMEVAIAMISSYKAAQSSGGEDAASLQAAAP